MLGSSSAVWTLTPLVSRWLAAADSSLTLFSVETVLRSDFVREMSTIRMPLVDASGGGSLHFENHSVQFVKNSCSWTEEKRRTVGKIDRFCCFPPLTIAAGAAGRRVRGIPELPTKMAFAPSH
ncbi:hypothetical protein KL86PLE_100647 [uncultured Pleomorphomonas sp.]|uniref:Uncharacterized protein n=1 Tax=uncultured Pleomorphomonas sp. TaxID=442121 RepID=A0A212L519_9HYPH|nr:hypothetical protein KL86PLE_100647 [uncultured Pleomorphomonas sp.]